MVIHSTSIHFINIIGSESLLGRLILVPTGSLDRMACQQIERMFSYRKIIGQNIFINISRFQIMIICQFIGTDCGQRISFSIVSYIILRIESSHIVHIIFISQT